MASFRELVYREYMTFFEKAERTRRWNVFNDIPWDKADTTPKSEELALCAETFCAVEMYLPDYVGQGINLLRQNFGQAWFSANWAYEESKHALTLREYLVRTGQRTEEQIFEFERQILDRRWQLPFKTPRQMTIYGAIQEMTTFVIYNKQERLARERNDDLLASIYGHIMRDEIAHCRFYEKVTALCLEEDPEGTKTDLAYVFKHFTMPAYDLIPDYESRITVMRTAGIDRTVFFKEVWLTCLKRLGLTRHDLPVITLKKAAEINGGEPPPMGFMTSSAVARSEAQQAS
jgi:acyl-[acyl-carrier-protein] desaturase